jgi:hypothetical protein
MKFSVCSGLEVPLHCRRRSSYVFEGLNGAGCMGGVIGIPEKCSWEEEI